MGEMANPDGRGHNNRPLMDAPEAPAASIEVVTDQVVIPSLKHVITEILNIDPKQRNHDIDRVVRLSDGPRQIEADRNLITSGPYTSFTKTTLRLTDLGVLRVSLSLLDNMVVDLTVKPTVRGEQLTLQGRTPELQHLAYEEVVNSASLMGLVIPEAL